MTETLAVGARVLLIRLSALGDVLFALETLASLKLERPDVRVDFLVEDRFAAVLAGHPQIERVLVFPRRRRLGILPAWRRLRAVRYDVVLDLHSNMKSALQTFVARSRRKIGFAAPIAREGAHRIYDERIRLPDPIPHRAEWGLHLLRAIGLRGEPASPMLPMPTEAPPFWRPEDRRRVVIHPGTSAFAAFKRWPLENFAALARRLIDAGCAVGISVGPGEHEFADVIRRTAPEARVLDGGLLGLAAVYRDADVLVAADTGPLHIAAAAGTPVVALFGPKDPRLYSPRGENHAILFADTPCRPCRRRRCVSPQCILGLEIDRVEAAVHARL